MRLDSLTQDWCGPNLQILLITCLHSSLTHTGTITKMTITKAQLATIGTLLSGATASAFTCGLRLTATIPRFVPRTPSAPSMADYDDSYPSDSSEDMHFTVEKNAEDAAAATIDVDNKPSTASESVVSSIMDYLPSSLASSGEISASDRASINEAILKLEALNPTKDPVYSPLINGVWTLRYAGGYSEPKIPSPTRDLALFMYSGGYSPGLFALGIAQKLPSQLVELGDLVICESATSYLASSIHNECTH
jgi:hypothetical protein